MPGSKGVIDSDQWSYPPTFNGLFMRGEHDILIWLGLLSAAASVMLPCPVSSSCSVVMQYLALVDAGLELLEEETGDTEETGDQTTLKEGQ